MKYRDQIIDKFMKDPALLYAYCENDINELAMNAITMWEYPRESEAYEKANDRTGQIVEWAQEIFLGSALAAEWEAELEQEERDYRRDEEIDYQRELQRDRA